MPDTRLKIRTQSRGPVSVLALSGELDVTTVGGLTDKAAAALATRPARLIVDLSALEFSDCGGARTLAALARSAELRPHAADRLAILSQEARQRAAAVRAACGVEQAPVAR